MKNLILPLLLTFFFYSCGNSFEKEQQEIDALTTIIDTAETVLLSVDTGEVFSTTRELKQELWNFGNKYDTLGKEAAFKVADYYRNKKNLNYFFENYSRFNKEIKVSRDQLIALKKDLNNGLITQDQFLSYYDNEQKIILDLNTKVKDAVTGLDISMDRIRKGKTEIKELLKQYEIDKGAE